MKSWIEVSETALRANYVAAQDAARATVLAVVKAHAYGHGATLCAPMLAAEGARWFGVSDVQEGVEVRTALHAAGVTDTHIVVMSGMEPADAGEIIAHKLTPVIWTLEHLAALEAAADATQSSIAVHLEVDTGMSRQGAVVGPELEPVLAQLKRAKRLRFEGIFGHLCCSEIVAAETTAAARATFSAALEQVREAGLQPRFVHLENTSAIDEGGSAQWLHDIAATMGAKLMVRPGLALYGYSLPLEGQATDHLHDALQPVMTWKTHVIGIRTIEAGVAVGYGASFVAAQPMRLALLPAGYADGFRREASSGMGNGWVMIAGQRAPVVGRVSMNLTVVDVSELAAVQVGAETVLLGAGVTAEDHARWARTIPYEILCGVKALQVAAV